MTHFRPAPSGLKGPRDLTRNNNKTSALVPGPWASSPRPPATCRRLGRARPCAALQCPARGVRRRADRALWPTSPADTAPPRETRGRAVAAAEQQEGSGRRGGRPVGLCGRRPCPGAEGGGGGPRGLLSGTPLPRRVSLSGSAPSLVRLAGPSRRGLIAFQLGGRGGGGAVTPSLIIAFSLFLPASLRSPEPGGARTWRGKLHPRPGPRTPPPPLSIILGTGNGLCIARCTCD